ncbi:unnamed protein product, partial [Allacma fusca]
SSEVEWMERIAKKTARMRKGLIRVLLIRDFLNRFSVLPPENKNHYSRQQLTPPSPMRNIFRIVKPVLKYLLAQWFYENYELIANRNKLALTSFKLPER